MDAALSPGQRAPSDRDCIRERGQRLTEHSPPRHPQPRRKPPRTGPLRRTELLDLPAAVPLWPTAAQALGIGRTKAHELARAGRFPVPVLRLGNTYRVKTADLWALLGIEPTIPREQPGPQHKPTVMLACTTCQLVYTPDPADFTSGNTGCRRCGGWTWIAELAATVEGGDLR